DSPDLELEIFPQLASTVFKDDILNRFAHNAGAKQPETDFAARTGNGFIHDSGYPSGKPFRLTAMNLCLEADIYAAAFLIRPGKSWLEELSNHKKHQSNSLPNARLILRTACFVRCSFSINAKRTNSSPNWPKPMPGETATFAS